MKRKLCFLLSAIGVVRAIRADFVVTEPCKEFLSTLRGSKIHKLMLAKAGPSTDVDRALLESLLVPVEFEVNRALKDGLLEQDVEYLSIPWATLIFAKVRKCLDVYSRMDNVIRSEVKKRGPSSRVPVFTVCGHTALRKETLECARSLGVTHFFSTQVHTSGAVLGRMKVLPLIFPASNGTPPGEVKDILYSFIGADTHAVRKKIFKMRAPVDSVIIKRAKYYGWQLNRARKERETVEYKDIMARSRFGLCPRGSYPNTSRLLELMQAGAIPIVIADALVLPDCFDWSECLVRVKERDVGRIDAIIRAISPEREKVMRRNCLAVYEQLQNDMAFPIRHYFETQMRGCTG